MRVLRRLRPNVPAVPSGCVATIGVFDGIHLGHQRILAQVIDAAARHRVPALVFSFEPTPQEVMNPANPPARLMRLREKVLALEEAGIGCLYCPPFDGALQSLAPEAFIDQVLVGQLGIRHLVVGDDFRFAHRRAGTFAHLEAGSRQFGFGVEAVGGVTVAGQRVSSTAIRQALAAGNVPLAESLLGHPYRMVGRVTRGRQLGRELGFPTANIRLHRRVSPVAGIFAVRIHGIDAGPRDAVASVGTRPTVDGVEPLLEVHVFDFDGDLYGRLVAVDFVAHLRDEVRFDDLDAMRRQIARDAAEARQYLTGATH
ncbi:MAG: bifunctional riboflavin kinase/FAD synthetase [Gammaproteobacteria bacterium PRO9]|nr:bifunctional riboflavin kinase/FAD synthetase [Gammaproteobacteria bacterium PRO9]